MKTITLHLTEVFSYSCTGCYYLDKKGSCTKPNEELDCVEDGQSYIFEEGE